MKSARRTIIYIAAASGLQGSTRIGGTGKPKPRNGHGDGGGGTEIGKCRVEVKGLAQVLTDLQATKSPLGRSTKGVPAPPPV